MSESCSTAEKYLSATMTSDLRLKPEKSSDVDQLLAAAYASRGDERMILALKVFRLRSTGDMTGAHALAERLGEMMRRQSLGIGRQRGGRQMRRSDELTVGQSKGVAMTLLKWWRMPTCPTCSGHGHPKMINAPVIDLTRECAECRGTGVIPVERIIRQEYADIARWMASEMDGLSAAVFYDMKKLLRPN